MGLRWGYDPGLSKEQDVLLRQTSSQARHWPPPVRLASESRCFSRIAWPLGHSRPPTVLAMGQNRPKTGKPCLLPPSTNSGRMGQE